MTHLFRPTHVRHFLALMLGALAAQAVLAADAPSAWAVDYSRWSNGQRYGKAEAAQDWPTLLWFDHPGAARVREFPAGSGKNWLDIVFPAGTYGGGAHGSKFAAELAPSDSYTIDYEVHFVGDWEFSQRNTRPQGGGKLPGISGGSHPSGGRAKPDGMSARPMWRRDTRFSDEPQNYLEVCLNWPGQAEDDGDRIFAQVVEAARTYHLKLRVDLGSSDEDGTVKLWIDDELRVDRPFRFLAPGQNWKLTQYMHHVFYGGNDSTWAPAHHQRLLLGPVRVDAMPF